MAESFVDTFKTELISDRVWRTPAQLELAIVEWVGWYNNRRLHGELGDIPPIEFELEHALILPPTRLRRTAAATPPPSGRRLRSSRPDTPAP